MMSTDPAIEQFYSLKPAQFPYIQELALSRKIPQFEAAGYTLKLTLASPTGDQRLILSCQGVKDIRVGNLDGMLATVLDIRSIADRHWENLHYRILDSEENVVSFYCDRFDAAVVGTPTAKPHTGHLIG